MESTLHTQLKHRFGSEGNGRLEVAIDGFRIDALGPGDVLVEVQSGALGPLRAKLARLLPRFRVRVVKPVVVGRRIVRRDRRDGADLSARWSPKRGARLDVFNDLVGLASVFPHPNLELVILDATIDEIRVPRRRRPGFTVVDRRLIDVCDSLTLRRAVDLWSLLPPGLVDPFTTVDLSEHVDRPIEFAQRVAYCLRLTRAAEVVSKRGNRIVYSRPRERRRTMKRGA
jgi:hypothetical protein